MRVSAVGFGAATLGGEYGPLELAVGERAVHAAIEHGINFFDVSPYYGRTLAEERLGAALLGRRRQVVLATKVGRYGREHPGGFDFSAERVFRSVDESLRRLRTDVIDLYLAHDIEFAPREVILGETLPAMRRLQEQGKVRAIGITGYPLELLRDVATGGEVAVILSYCHLNLLNTRMESVLGPMKAAGHVGLVNASPLHMGVLTRHGAPDWHPAPERVLDRARAAAAACATRGADISELALRFALSRHTAASTLVGLRNEEEVLAGIAALDEPPDPDLLREIMRILEPAVDVEWRSGLPENCVPDGRDEGSSNPAQRDPSSPAH